MNIRDAWYQIELSDGSKWAVPVRLIAESRARYYHTAHPDEFPTLDSALEDTYVLFDESDYEVSDRARNNMNWDEVAESAKQLTKPDKPDLQEAWINPEEWEVGPLPGKQKGN